MTRYNDALVALIDKCGKPNPTIADLVRIALDTIDIDADETAAATVLNLIFLHDNLSEALYGRL